MSYCCTLTVVVIVGRQDPARVRLSGRVAEGFDEALSDLGGGFGGRYQGEGFSTGGFGAGDVQELGYGGSGD